MGKPLESGGSGGRKARILALDNDPATLTIVRTLLERHYRVVTVDRGEVALAEAERQDFDLYILDLATPGVNGQDVARFLSGRANPPPILLASGHPRVQEIARAIGATDWISKPFSLPELRSKVENALGSSRASSPGHEHEVEFYKREASAMERAGAFLREGLRKGEAAVAVVTPPHWERIVESLERSGHDVDGLLRKGRLRRIDSHQVLARVLVKGKPEEDAFRGLVEPLFEGLCPSGNRRLRIFGEAVGLLASGGQVDAAFRLEEMWNRIKRERPFALF